MSVSVEADLYDFINDSIKHWVGKNFGSQELDDPSWNIDALTTHLTKALNKRNRAVKNMAGFDLTIFLKDMPDEQRADIVSKTIEKLERVGGSMELITYDKEKFDSPIEGETEGIKVKIKVDIPTDRFALRGFTRWLDRQQSGHGTILKHTLAHADGFLF